MLETSILSFIDSISIYRSRVLETRVPKSKTDLNFEIWRKTEEERFEARSEETKRWFEEEDLKKNRGRTIWGTIWRNEETIWRGRSDLKRHDLVFKSTIKEQRRRTKNEERSDTPKNVRKKKWNSSFKNSISTNRDLKTRFFILKLKF